MYRHFLLYCVVSGLLVCMGSAYPTNKGNTIRIEANNEELHVIDVKKIGDQLIEISFQQDESCGFYTDAPHNIESSPSIVAVSRNVSEIRTIWPKCNIVTNKFGEVELTNAICYGNITFRVEFNAFKDEDTIMRFQYFTCCKDMCYPGSVIINSMRDGSVNVDHDNLEVDLDKKDSQGRVDLYDIISIVILSFIGGFIMNLMPCVLPILGIKILSITQHSKESKATIRLALLSTLLGIIVSFLIFASASLSIMVLFDSDLGIWGSIFQNRYFVSIMCLVMFFVIEFQLGDLSYKVTDISARCYRYLSQRGNIFLSSFIYGLFITLIAAPCTAPFAGQAISAAAGYSSRSLFLSMLIFITMGLGFGTPYLVAIIYPQIVQMIPKTGRVTGIFSKVIGITLFITLIWMLYILSGSIGTVGILIVSISMVTTSVFMRLKINKKLLISILIALVGFSTYFFNASSKHDTEVSWTRLTPQELDKYIGRNDIVLVNVTASWCAVCKFNNWTVLSRSEFSKVVNDYRVVLMEGDITRKNEVVSDFLKSVGSRSIPYTAIFSSANPTGRILHSVLTLDYIRKEIEIESKAMDEYEKRESMIQHSNQVR